MSSTILPILLIAIHHHHQSFHNGVILKQREHDGYILHNRVKSYQRDIANNKFVQTSEILKQTIWQ